MYVGNGEATAFPLPRGHDGGRCLYRRGGDVVVLREGEGYHVEDGQAVFEAPPPEGDVITFASAPSEAIDAEAALARIVQAIAAADAVSAAAKTALAEVKAWGARLRDEMMSEISDERTRVAEAVNACEAELDAALADHVSNADGWYDRRMDETLRVVKKFAEDADDAKLDADRAARTAQTMRDEAACALAELAELVKTAGEVLDASAHEHVRNIEASAMKKCAVMEQAFDRLQNSLKKEAGWVSELQDKASSINRRLAEIQDRGGRVIG